MKNSVKVKCLIFCHVETCKESKILSNLMFDNIFLIPQKTFKFKKHLFQNL